MEGVGTERRRQTKFWVNIYTPPASSSYSQILSHSLTIFITPTKILTNEVIFILIEEEGIQWPTVCRALYKSTAVLPQRCLPPCFPPSGPFTTSLLLRKIHQCNPGKMLSNPSKNFSRPGFFSYRIFWRSSSVYQRSLTLPTELLNRKL